MYIFNYYYFQKGNLFHREKNSSLSMFPQENPATLETFLKMK